MKKLAVLVLVLLAILSALVAVVYFTKTAANLPHFYPGYAKDSTHKHLKHGVVFIVLALVFLLGAWMASGNKAAKITTEKTQEDK